MKNFYQFSEEKEDVAKRSLPKRTKIVSSPDKFEQGQHISHFENLAAVLQGKAGIFNLDMGRLNDDGQGYDEVVLSGQKTKVEIASKTPSGVKTPSKPISMHSLIPSPRGVK